MEKYFKDSLNKINVELDDEQIIKFFSYMDLLVKWNEMINLTSITEPKEIITKHFIDSLSVLQFLDEKDINIIDIGTGAGFPGIPMKIARPDLNITLVDSLNKRVKFLNEVINELELKNIKAVHGRAEEMGRKKEYREKFDTCVSRAVAHLRVLSEFSIPFVNQGGKFISLKGPKVVDELKEAKSTIKKLGGKAKEVTRLSLPNSHDNYYVVVIDKIEQTPKLFPRNMGKINNNPI